MIVTSPTIFTKKNNNDRNIIKTDAMLAVRKSHGEAYQTICFSSLEGAELSLVLGECEFIHYSLKRHFLTVLMSIIPFVVMRESISKII